MDRRSALRVLPVAAAFAVAGVTNCGSDPGLSTPATLELLRRARFTPSGSWNWVRGDTTITFAGNGSDDGSGSQGSYYAKTISLKRDGLYLSCPVEVAQRASFMVLVDGLEPLDRAGLLKAGCKLAN